MICYHGTPLSPSDALIGLQGKNFLVSFWRSDQIALVAEIASTFILDNGAFSAYKNGASLDWGEYKEFVYKWALPNMNFHIIPDVIGGSWQENQKLIEKWDAPRAAPVWHMSEPLELLDEYVQDWEIVCIGGHVGVYGDVGGTYWWQRMNDVMNTVCDDEGVPRCKIHGLMLLNPDLRSIPMYSADSTNIAQNLTKSGMSRRTAAIMLSERIESVPGAHRWEGIPRQTDFFDTPNRFNPSHEATAWRL